jgi:hypothetical protein
MAVNTVLGPNAKPAAASSTLTTLEDQTLVLLPVDFAFKDANIGDFFQKVSITALPGFPEAERNHRRCGPDDCRR